MRLRYDAQRLRRYCGAVAALLPLACLAVGPARADLVLLDEHWAPEIVANDVEVTEIDTVATGDPSQAKFGEWSVRLVNATGAPNVRFRGAACVTLPETPALDREGRLWYRTDAWSGKLAMEIWTYYHDPASPAPLLVLRAFLDGGGEDGALIADDEWHEARGLLAQTPDYEQMPKDIPLVAYVWLAPVDGWDIAHTTFIDRIEVLVSDTVDGGEPAPEPAAHIRPQPGRQSTGEGWIWWEGEDAIEHNVPPGGVLSPHTADQQRVFSNDAWLAHHGVPGFAVTWEVDVAEDAEYGLWSRGLGASFEWRWDGGEWQSYVRGAGRVDPMEIRDQGTNTLSVSWTDLGTVKLAAGKHVLEARAGADGRQLGFDCWLLSRDPFHPNGAAKPAGD